MLTKQSTELLARIIPKSTYWYNYVENGPADIPIKKPLLMEHDGTKLHVYMNPYMMAIVYPEMEPEQETETPSKLAQNMLRTTMTMRQSASQAGYIDKKALMETVRPPYGYQLSSGALLSPKAVIEIKDKLYNYSLFDLACKVTDSDKMKLWIHSNNTGKGSLLFMNAKARRCEDDILFICINHKPTESDTLLDTTCCVFDEGDVTHDRISG